MDPKDDIIIEPSEAEEILPKTPTRLPAAAVATATTVPSTSKRNISVPPGRSCPGGPSRNGPCLNPHEESPLLPRHPERLRY